MPVRIAKTPAFDLPVDPARPALNVHRARARDPGVHAVGRSAAISRPFPRPETGRVAVKVINHVGDAVMQVFGVCANGQGGIGSVFLEASPRQIR